MVHYITHIKYSETKIKDMNDIIKERKRRKLVIFDAIKITFIVYVIIFTSGMLGDGVGVVGSQLIGATPEEIYNASNQSLFERNWFLFFYGFPLLTLAVVGMLEYLQHGK